MMKVAILAAAFGMLALETSSGAQQAMPAPSKAEAAKPVADAGVADPATTAGEGSAAVSDPTTLGAKSENDPLAAAPPGAQPSKAKKASKKKK